MKKKLFVLLVVLVLVAGTAFAAGAAESKPKTVELEFLQWWEPELPAGSLRAIIDDFEAQNPGIKVKLISGPNASIYDQIISGTATGTLSDVVGMDGKWVYDLTKAGGVIPLDKYLDSPSFPHKNDISVITKVEGESMMFPLVTFMYPVFVNLELLEKNGITGVPTTRSEFAAMAKAVTDPSKNQYGWVLPFPVQSSAGLRMELMSFYWANGHSMLKDGKPDLTNPKLVETLLYVKDLYDTAISPGAFTKTEQDKLEEFSNGRVAFMINSLAAINKLNERAPNLNYTLIDIPTDEGYTGQRYIRYADWGVGISASSKHPDEAWKLIQFLISPEVNQRLASIANGLPGNKTVTPDWVDSPNPMFKVAFDIFKRSQLINEYLALPNSDEMGRRFATELQRMFSGQISAEEAARNAQQKWMEIWI